MLDDPPEETPSASDRPNPARVYREYLLTCRRLGIMPTSPERVKALLEEWMTAAVAGRADPPTTR